MSKLKAHKNEGNSELSSDHIIHADSDLMVHVACLFTAAIVHATAPVVFLPSTIIPIPKGRSVNLSVSVIIFAASLLVRFYVKILILY